jgi:putative transposase
MKMQNDAARFPGSARVSRVGDGVSPSRTFLDVQPGEGAFYSRRCLSPAARTIVLDALRHFHNKRYELFAACVMPDHVHFLIQPWPKETNNEGNVIFWPLSELIHSIKSFSAHEINKVENKRGAVWGMERFDRYVRSDRDLQEKFHYILRNPWDAGVARQNQAYPWLWIQEDELRKESWSRRDSATNTRDACATQSSAGNAP